MGKKKEKEIKELKLKKVKSTKKRVKKLNKAVVAVDKELAKHPIPVYYIPRANLLKSLSDIYPIFKNYAIDSQTDIDHIKLNVDGFVVMDGMLHTNTIGISMDYSIVIKVPKSIYTAIYNSNFNIKETTKMHFHDKDYCLEKNLSTLMGIAGCDDARYFNGNGTLNDTFPFTNAKVLLPVDKNHNTRRVKVIDRASKIYFKDEKGKKVKDIIVL